MSKKKFLHRYKTIINFLKINRYASFEEIEKRLESNLLDQGHTDGYSLRTFQRDMKDMEEFMISPSNMTAHGKDITLSRFNPTGPASG